MILPRKTLAKSADETVNNSTALQDDDHLTFSIAAYEYWMGMITLDVQGSAIATSDFKLAITTPTGAVLQIAAVGMDNTSTNAEGSESVQGQTSGTGIALSVGANTNLNAQIYFYVANGATAGSVTLQWAQNTADASDLTVKKGSYLVAWRRVLVRIQ